MNRVKFYKEQPDGSFACIGVSVCNGGYDCLGHRVVTLSNAERVMAQLGWVRKSRLTPTQLRKLPPGGGLHANRKVTVQRKVPDSEPAPLSQS